ncbi:endothelial differentiation-related factor 1, partial [Oxyura jamaicensis]|uniref:endothelial differentiation-related factor 1 n=1 Tax=Oxyura jamaicensis TaxID=8884 RepID=UPI0015A59C98
SPPGAGTIPAVTSSPLRGAGSSRQSLLLLITGSPCAASPSIPHAQRNPPSQKPSYSWTQGAAPPVPPQFLHVDISGKITATSKAALPKPKQAILAAQRRGEDVETSKKWAAGQNKQHFITKNTAKLDRETEELHHDRVPLEVGKVIQQGRQSKGMTQKDLATKINEKPQVIADYESGRAIPNNQVMGKIERAIGLKLRGKDIGKPLETGPKGK